MLGLETREATLSIGALTLDSGEVLPSVNQHATIYGSTSNPVVLIAHTLTGSSRICEWWPAIVGSGCLFDPRDWCVIGINALGSCYGSTGPGDCRALFPHITVRDIVRAQVRALDELKVPNLAFVVGGSFGGMQALQWALAYPDRIRNAIVVGAHDHHTSMGVALNAIQRECLDLDPVEGLRTARKLAMLTYKSDTLLRQRHGRLADRRGRPYFDVEGYLDHQADLFEDRMDAATYCTLTQAMDSFDARTELTFAPEQAPRLTFVGISSDWLFRPQDVRAAADQLSAFGYDASYVELLSESGHDAFLSEQAALGVLLQRTVDYSQL